MKKNMMILLITMVLLGLSACTGQQSEAAFQPDDSALRVISLGPNVTEILVALGLEDTLVAIDEHAADIPGLPDGLPQLSIMPIDAEQLIALAPDIIFAAGLVRAEGDDPFSVVTAAGVTIVDIPSSDSIEGIMEDIRLIAETLDISASGEILVAQMEQAIDEIRAISETITDRQTVYFEISAAPFMFSFGRGTFLHEMVELVGAYNVFADDGEWVSVADEAILAVNPDVILTNVSYLDDPISEIMSRPGWEVMAAVQNGRIYQISTNASSRPSHNIVVALWEMAAAIYPGYFGG